MNGRTTVSCLALLAGGLFTLGQGRAGAEPAQKAYRELAQLEGLNVHGLAQDGAFVYVGVRTAKDQQATIYKVPKAGGPKVAIYTGPDLPGVMVARPSGVYFTRTTEAGGIMVVPIAGGASKRLDTGDLAPAAELRAVGSKEPALTLRAPYDNLVVDGEQVFVSSGLAKMVGVLPRAGGSLKVLASPGSRVTGLATDKKTVYYATEDGQIRHVAKSGAAGGLDLKGRDAPHDLIAIENGLAWAEGKLIGPGSCFLAVRSAAGPRPIPFPDQWSQISSLAKSGDTLWFVFADRYQISRLAKAPLAGGPAVEQPGPFEVGPVVADAEAVYFVAVSKDAKSKYVGAIGR
jgi:hypothetical protein